MSADTSEKPAEASEQSPEATGDSWDGAENEWYAKLQDEYRRGYKAAFLECQSLTIKTELEAILIQLDSLMKRKNMLDKALADLEAYAKDA